MKEWIITIGAYWLIAIFVVLLIALATGLPEYLVKN